jgi:hypothetical protein
MPFDVFYKLDGLYALAEHDPEFENVVDDTFGEMARYYHQSVATPHRILETKAVKVQELNTLNEYPILVERPMQTLKVKNYTWVGPKGRLLRVEGDKIVESLLGNLYEMPKLYAVAETPRELTLNEIEKSIPFFTGFVKPFTLTEQQYLNFKSDYEDYGEEDYADLSEEDIGKVFFEVVDGHHRSIGAILSGDPFVYAEIVPEVYIPYREWVLQGRDTDHKDYVLFAYLDKHLL